MNTKDYVVARISSNGSFGSLTIVDVRGVKEDVWALWNIKYEPISEPMYFHEAKNYLLQHIND